MLPHESGEPTPTRQSPQFLGYATPQSAAINLRRIASQQRAINLCILTQLVSLTMMCGGATRAPGLAIVAELLYFVAMIVGTVYAFMLAISLYDIAVGIILGILTLIPLLGWIILLIINGRATHTLRRHGIRVGLLGANPSSIPIDAGS